MRNKFFFGVFVVVVVLFFVFFVFFPVVRASERVIVQSKGVSGYGTVAETVTVGDNMVGVAHLVNCNLDHVTVLRNVTGNPGIVEAVESGVSGVGGGVNSAIV